VLFRSVEKKGKSTRSKAAPETDDDDDIMLLTQDKIDEKFNRIEKDNNRDKKAAPREEKTSGEASEASGDDGVKILDIALEKGTLNKNEIDKEKKKVRFFKENFPGGEY
jgi:hypothetical protein